MDAPRHDAEPEGCSDGDVLAGVRESAISKRLTELHALSLLLSTSSSVDDLCRRAVEHGRECLGLDRLGIWFFLPDDPTQMSGTYGIDEDGTLRDERSMHIPFDSTLFPANFLDDKVPYILFKGHDVYDHRRQVVGSADLAVAPIWNGELSMGILCADNLLSGVAMDEETCQILALLARTVGHLANLKMTEAKLRESEARLQKLATTDGLTGVLNRRTGLEVLDQQLRLARRNGSVLSLCYVDLNGLKNVNDTQGHHVGDQLILGVAAILLETLRDSDVVCRLGGDELMLVLPGSSKAQAEQTVGRLIAATEASEKLRAIKPPPYFSYGLAEFSGASNDSTTPEGLIQLADQVMYQEKRRQRGEPFRS